MEIQNLGEKSKKSVVPEKIPQYNKCTSKYVLELTNNARKNELGVRLSNYIIFMLQYLHFVILC